jgi:hypothetical protein
MSEHYDIPKVGPGWFKELCKYGEGKSLSSVLVCLILIPYAGRIVVFTIYLSFVLD